MQITNIVGNINIPDYFLNQNFDLCSKIYIQSQEQNVG